MLVSYWHARVFMEGVLQLEWTFATSTSLGHILRCPAAAARWHSAAWYGRGICFVAAAYSAYPSPHSRLTWLFQHHVHAC